MLIYLNHYLIFTLKATNEELASEEINTTFYDITLRLLRNNKGIVYMEFFMKMKAEHESFQQSFYININALPWIRRTIAQILKENDDSEQIPKMPIINKFPFSLNK